MKNNKVRIKICGLSAPQDIHAVNKYRPDYIGFVFAPKSRRYVTVQKASELKKLLSPDIQAVGVFVNESVEKIADICAWGIIDSIQLHGQETESDIRWLKKHTKRTVIKAVNVRTESDITCWCGSLADYLLLDHGCGGTGCTFDWNLAQACTRPYFLAGGIHSGNLLSALDTGAYAVDISGGVETDGRKDPVKIAEIMHMMHTQNADGR